MPNGEAPDAMLAMNTAAIAVTVMIAVRLARLIAAAWGSAGDAGGVFGKRQAKNSTKAIQGRNTSGIPLKGDRALQRLRQRQFAPRGQGAVADKPRIDFRKPQREGKDGERCACEHEQRARIAIDPPPWVRHRKRHPEAQHHEQEAPFGHEPNAEDEVEEKRPSSRRLLGISERCNPERKSAK